MKKNDWIPADCKPVRTGVYMTSAVNRFIEKYQYWDGKRWGLYTSTPEQAEKMRLLRSGCQKVQWRGLTSEGGV